MSLLSDLPDLQMNDVRIPKGILKINIISDNAIGCFANINLVLTYRTTLSPKKTPERFLKRL